MRFKRKLIVLCRFCRAYTDSDTSLPIQSRPKSFPERHFSNQHFSNFCKPPYKTFCSPLFIEHKLPNHGKKIYYHTVKELNCPRSGLTALNARSF